MGLLKGQIVGNGDINVSGDLAASRAKFDIVAGNDAAISDDDLGDRLNKIGVLCCDIPAVDDIGF
jgi:hypothetical protein